MHIYLVTLFIGLTVFIGACEKEGTDRADKHNGEKPGQRSGTETADAGIVDFIKKQKLANFQSTTIGNAFDSYRYVTKKEWKTVSMQSRHVIVDFSGWFEPRTLNDHDMKDGVTDRGIDVTFVIEPDGSFYVFMVSKIESRSDGKVYRFQLDDIAGILEKIYANKKITF